MLATPEWLSNRMILDNVWERACYNLLVFDSRHFRTNCVAVSQARRVQLLASGVGGHLLNSPGLLFRISP